MSSTDAVETRYVVGVDVGTASARAGIFTLDGTLLAVARRGLALHLEAGEIAEYAGEEIWQAVAGAITEAMAMSDIKPAAVAGIGFDATCSLVVIGREGRPLPVGHPDRPERNVIAWMDHRAVDQARRINASGHPVLDFVGGSISPEMQTPKLLWLKESRPTTFAKASHFFDLVDYLTWRSTGSTVRSLCTVTCKWTYLAHEQRWDSSYFHGIGLSELADENFLRIGREVTMPGTSLGGGLLPAAAADFGLPIGTPVAAGLIDAHAGGIATVGAEKGGDSPITRMGYVLGTSACTMVSAATPVKVEGVWGPYYSAMLPGLWLNEGGQSAAGSAIDKLIRMHRAGMLDGLAGSSDGEKLAALATTRVATLSDAVLLAGSILVVPDFRGNRAPFADPAARAIIAGLDLEESLEGLIALYVAGLCGVGYGARQIVAAYSRSGIGPRSIVVSGGAARSDLVRQLIADTTRLEVASVESDEPVLLGAAMLGAVAGGLVSLLSDAMTSMSRVDRRYRPTEGHLAHLQEKRFVTYEGLQAAGRATRY